MRKKTANRIDHYFKTNRKKEQMIEKLSKNLEKERRKNQCDCLHTGNNGYDVRLDKRGPNGEIFLRCKNCKKLIRANRIADKRMTEAILDLDSACDTVKMHLDPNRNKDMIVASWLAEFQYRLDFNIELLYKATQQNKSNNGKGDSSIYGKTTITRRR